MSWSWVDETQWGQSIDDQTTKLDGVGSWNKYTQETMYAWSSRTVDNMLENITNSICSKVSKAGLVILIPGDDAEEDYVSERRLFYKGVRDRNQKADREALEKMEVQR